MRHSNQHPAAKSSRIGKLMAWLGLAIASANFIGCSANSFYDQSRTGRFDYYPTTIPVLDRLDVIEQQKQYFSNASPVSPEDLLPRDLAYYLYPGDVVTVGIYELYEPGRWATVTRRIDAGGNYRVPELGDVRAAGLTAQQFEDQVIQLVSTKIMTKPQVDVVVEQSGGLRYTIYGYVQNPGVFNLVNPDLRLLDALAIAGGVPFSTERVYVIRQVVLSEDVKPAWEHADRAIPPSSTRPSDAKPADIEDLIKQLDQPRNTDKPRVSPGMLPLPQDSRPMVDIDQLEPVRVPGKPPVDVDAIRAQTRPTGEGSSDAFIYDEQRGEWVRVPAGSVQHPAAAGSGAGAKKPPAATGTAEPSLILDRIISIDYERLAKGESNQNIVIRPNDRIYVDGPFQGFVYVDGEVIRPGVYALPGNGTLTLSRLIAAAGGLGPIAVPEKVDLTRKVGLNREATVRLDLAAIRQKTEPDVVVKPDDMIIVGTSWFATPLAIIRNGFRATYGFGFVLDRNFGPDVFGPEPVSNGF